MEFYMLRNLVERVARKQRIATLAAGIRAASYAGRSQVEIVEEALLLDHEIERSDNAVFGSSASD